MGREGKIKKGGEGESEGKKGERGGRKRICLRVST